jgi:2-polyprenyl-3-methyl-5-hydroxy-6-metoxy-1,4-benzoquinol methylase
MELNQKSKAEGDYWADVNAELKGQGLSFRNREDFVAKDPKYYWEDGNLMKKILGYPKSSLRSYIKPGIKALDLGSGSGGNSYMMAKLGADVLGVDVQERTIKFLNEEIADEKDLKLKFEVGDLNVKEFPENEYDLVLSWNSFHHVEETDYLISQVKKTLKPDGVFILFEHQHTSSLLRKGLAAFFWLLLPTREGFKEKWQIIRGRAKGKGEDELSPAEDSAHEDYLDKLKAAFELQEEKSFLGFTSPFIARIRGQRLLRPIFVSIVNSLDRLLIGLNLLKGEQVYLVFKKK